jgi:hypothetical protein
MLGIKKIWFFVLSLMVVEVRIEPDYLKRDFEREFADWHDLELTPEMYPSSMEVEKLLKTEVALFYVRDWPVPMTEKIVGQLVGLPERMSVRGKFNYVIINQAGEIRNVSPIHVGGIKIRSNQK